MSYYQRESCDRKILGGYFINVANAYTTIEIIITAQPVLIMELV